MTLTDRELNIEIAVKLGAKWSDATINGFDGKVLTKDGGKTVLAVGFQNGEYQFWNCPDYCNDISATWALEDSVPEWEVLRYIDILHGIVCPTIFADDRKDHWRLAHSTARQKAQAWLIWKGQS